MEHLASLAQIELPEYAEPVSVSSPTGELRESARWRAGARGRLRSLPSVEFPRGALPLETGVEADVVVSVEGSTHITPDLHPDRAALVFWIPLADPGQLRTLADTLAYIQNRGVWQWIRHPDTMGLVAAARARLEQHAASLATAAAQRQVGAGRRWAQIRRNAAGTMPGAFPPEPPSTTQALVPPAAGNRAAEVDSWAKRRKANSGFILYRLRDGSAWVIYQLDDGASAVIPWPERVEGWDESLPSTFPIYDAEIDAFRLKDLTRAMLFLRERASAVRNTYSPLELMSL
jgi:hypothetical protein